MKLINGSFMIHTELTLVVQTDHILKKRHLVGHAGSFSDARGHGAGRGRRVSGSHASGVLASPAAVAVAMSGGGRRWGTGWTSGMGGRISSRHATRVSWAMSMWVVMRTLRRRMTILLM